ncbi:MAG: hypothetical protein VYE22_27120 [Myxococcota bacterium]|nr:hypothetical protein [Myxococcota bacterium]
MSARTLSGTRRADGRRLSSSGELLMVWMIIGGAVAIAALAWLGCERG